MATPTPDAQRIGALLREAQELMRIGNAAGAARQWERVLAIEPHQPEAALQLAGLCLAQNDPASARALIEGVLSRYPRMAMAHAYLAKVEMAAGDAEAALACLNEATRHDANAWGAQFQKAELLESLGRNREAALCWSAALKTTPPDAARQPHVAERLQRAQQSVNVHLASLREVLEELTADIRAQEPERHLRRFEHALDILTGRRELVTARPLMLPIPRLPAIPFFERDEFPWAAEVEAATPLVLRELEGISRSDPAGYEPYVQTEAGEATGQFADLDRNEGWSAYFLWKHGTRIEPHCDRCPATLAAIERAPLVRIPGRAPAAFFSRLAPGVHIPPHNGVTNSRLTVHLPLIVPEGCGFRVGDETRQWTPGELLIFDDTIRHEAWNHGREYRTVLIFDIWHPMLTPVERELVTRTVRGMVDFFSGAQELGEI